jgi:hypothetical protein
MNHYLYSQIACILFLSLVIIGCRDRQYPRSIHRILKVEKAPGLDLGPLHGSYHPKRLVRSITSLKSFEEIERNKNTIENFRTSIYEPSLSDSLVNLVNSMPNLRCLSVHFRDSFESLERLSISKLTAFFISSRDYPPKEVFPRSLLHRNNLVSLSIEGLNSSSVFWNLSGSDLQFKKLKYLELGDRVEESFPALYPTIRNLEYLSIFDTNIKRLDYSQIDKLGLRSLGCLDYTISNFDLDSLAKTSLLFVFKGGDEVLFRCDKSQMFTDTLIEYDHYSSYLEKLWKKRRSQDCPDVWFAH